MAAIIGWILSNVFLWTAILAVILGFLRKHEQLNCSGRILRQLFFWFVGVAFVWYGFMHLVFADFTAAKIGWAPSPFQFEVGLENLSIAALGFMAFFNASRYFWLGTLICLSIFSVGAGLGHIYQAILYHDYAQSNSGSILYTDIIVPIVMFVLWFKTNNRDLGSVSQSLS